jgi:antitoxin component YwqK of YwqJK toxin-antitoxin module
MAAAFMEQRARYLNNISWLAGVLLAACAQPPHQVFNRDEVTTRTQAGITYVNNQPFSGTLFRLFPASTDTMQIENYKDGKEEGEWKQFYPHHQLKEKRYFKKGKKEGLYQAWWENGQLKSEHHFSQDEYEGNCKDWSPRGLLVRNMNFHQGHEQGLQQLWQSDGTLWANYEARNGRNYGLVGVKGCATLWKSNEH